MKLFDEPRRLSMFPFMRPDQSVDRPRPFERAEYNKATQLIEMYYEGGFVIALSVAEAVGWTMGMAAMLAALGQVPPLPTLHVPDAPAPDDPTGGL